MAKTVPGGAALQQSSRAIHLSEDDGRAADVLGELVFPGSAEELSDGPCKGDLGLQWRTGVGEGVRPSVRMFCAVLGWM